MFGIGPFFANLVLNIKYWDPKLNPSTKSPMFCLELVFSITVNQGKECPLAGCVGFQQVTRVRSLGSMKAFKSAPFWFLVGITVTQPCLLFLNVFLSPFNRDFFYDAVRYNLFNPLLDIVNRHG